MGVVIGILLVVALVGGCAYGYVRLKKYAEKK